MTNEKLLNLKHIYMYVRAVCVNNGYRRENVPIDPKWLTFEGFVKDNWIRYYRAIIKWRGYEKLSKHKDRDKALKYGYIVFKRKIKEFGYTKDNTVFTSLSDSKKYSINTHKYMFEDRLLGTRDIKNILRKRGINIGIQAICNRLNKGVDLFSPSVDNLIKWKGKYRSFVEIASLENIDYSILKNKYYQTKDIKQAIQYAKNTKHIIYYEFEGRSLTRRDISKILSDRTGMNFLTIETRFKKHGLDLEKLLAPLGCKSYSSVAKKVVAKKNGVEYKFNSMADAAKELNLRAPGITNVLKGRQAHTGGYTFSLVK